LSGNYCGFTLSPEWTAKAVFLEGVFARAGAPARAKTPFYLYLQAQYTAPGEFPDKFLTVIA